MAAVASISERDPEQVQLPSVVRGQRQDVEVLRIVGAFGVVWYHSRAPGYEFGYAGLMIFLIMGFYLAAKSRVTHSVRSRAERLLLPWLAWTLFFAVVNVLTHRPVVPDRNGWLLGLLTGTHVHLWYLPYVFAVLLLLDAAKAHLRTEVIGYGSGVLAVALLATLPAWRPWSLTLVEPLPEYCNGIVAALIGVFVACYPRLAPRPRLLVLATLLLAGAMLAIAGSRGVGLPYFMALCLAVPVLLLRPGWPWPWTVGRLSACTLGIYLVHPFFLMLLFKRALPGLLLPLAVFAVSAVCVMALRRWAPAFARWAL